MYNSFDFVISRVGANTGEPVSTDVAAVAGSIAAVVFVLAVAAIIITYYCRQRRKSIEKSKEYELRLTGPGTHFCQFTLTLLVMLLFHLI